MTAEVSITDLVSSYDQWQLYRTSLTESIAKELANADAMLEQLDAQILQAIPAESTGMKFISKHNGDSLTFAPKVTSRYQIEPGKSDDFYKWLAENGRTDMLTRSIKQSAIDAEIAKTKALPPFIGIETTKKLSVTRKRAAPAPTGV